MGYKSFGIHWCPECFARREFVSYEESHRDAKFAECFACEYMFGEKVDEHVIDPATGAYTTVVSNVLSDTQVRDAQNLMAAEHRTALLSTGVRRELLAK